MAPVYYYRSLSFPEEIIHEILNYNLRLSHHEFFGPGCYETINRRREIRKLGKAAPPSCSAALLVCKRWLRIGTPLLYESIKLSSLQDTQAVLNVVRANEGISKFIRRLRLEGGFGRALGELAKYLYNVEHLLILPDVRARESVTGLHILFPELNLRTLKIEDKRKTFNRNTDYINHLLQHSIRHYWPNLVGHSRYFSLIGVASRAHVVFFQKQISVDKADNMAPVLVGALQDTVNVEEFVVTEPVAAAWLGNGLIERILENTAVKRIVCYDERFATLPDGYVRERLSLSDEDKAKMHFIPAPEDVPLYVFSGYSTP